MDSDQTDRNTVLVRERQRKNLQLVGRFHLLLVVFFLAAWILSPQMAHWATAVACLVVLATASVTMVMAWRNVAIGASWLILMVVDAVVLSAATYPNLAFSINPRGTALAHQTYLLLFLSISLFSLDRRVIAVLMATIVVLQIVFANTVGTPLTSQVVQVGLIFLFGLFGTTLVNQALNLLVEVENLSNLKRFFSPAVATLILNGQVDAMKTHRTEITVVFVDLRGFTSFTENTMPDEVMRMLREYHRLLGALIVKYEGTVEHFAGDGIMIFFNDPIPSPNPAMQAVEMAIDMRSAFGRNMHSWTKGEHPLGMGIGIAQGPAIMGAIGFDGRRDYAAVGAVCNLTARLCAEAQSGQILVEQKVAELSKSLAAQEQVGPLRLKGISQPVVAFNVLEP